MMFVIKILWNDKIIAQELYFNKWCTLINKSLIKILLCYEWTKYNIYLINCDVTITVDIAYV